MAARSLALTFLGATSTITGARYLLDAGHARVLVDCGLYQGFKQLRLRNRTAFLPPTTSPTTGSTDCSQHDQPPQLDAIVLTHAHLDHSGFLPRLCRAGFRGPVYCTAGTAALCGLLLPDSAALQLHDAAFANKKGYSKSHPATPLYDLEDAAQAVRQLVPTPFGERFNLPGGLQGSFTRAGHMLGAASLRVDDGVRRVLFSGDLGREQDIMMAPPESRPQADIVVLESTYGGRAHDGEDPAEALADLIRRTATRGGRVLIPAFAFGRAQALLVLLHQLRRARKIPELPVFVDSPLACDPTDLYAAHPRDHRLPRELCEAAFGGVHYLRTSEASRLCSESREPAIVLASAGLATGGRVLHHLKRTGPDPNSAIVLAGIQAAGTRGATLAAGADSLKIHGRNVSINAEVAHFDMLTAHADQHELLGWLEHDDAPRHTFLVHGEAAAADALRRAIEEQLRWPVSVPDYRDTVDVHAL